MGTTWDSRTIWEFKFSAFGFLDLTLTPGGFLFGWLQVDDAPASTHVENRFLGKDHQFDGRESGFKKTIWFINS